MPDRNPTTLGNAFKEERRRSAVHTYPGSLAGDVLQSGPKPSTGWPIGRLALLTAAIGIALGVGFSLLHEPTARPAETANHQPDHAPPEVAPVAPDTATEAVAQGPTQQNEYAQPTPEPAVPATDQVASNSPPPDIDRGLLPVQRGTSATWLASPAARRDLTDRHQQLAGHPDPSKRVRASLGMPTKRTIDRLFKRNAKTQAERT